MKSLKIEYVDGKLVALERDGKSYMDLPVSAVHFTHSMKTNPYLKVEIEAGGEPYVPAEPAHPPAAAEKTVTVKEGELMPPDDSASKAERRSRHRNRNRNRSQ
ncbi:TPA: hypothetical protein NRZ83_003957 [Klebsiella pneumoniae]|nr:hypothetical protein [Klebsiella pneumoniae]HCJ3801331.1 hypothetical protein [Klebsiella pneumoniae]HDT3775142.1 hypothetical protein [Klebsiella pneumoniae subsp. pneumoniae]HDU5346494.1 hypothetical protein [Klebsiella pneumoniae subsp. pneumoniae]HDU5382101.1 hypothetical protein [Klebsiella pneumoniae subsp. pneumoniae]